MNDDTLKVGLLMESAQTHQRLVEENLERLKAHTRDLDGVVREEIRRTLIEELQAVTAESSRATAALQGVRRVANLRTGLWAAGVSVLCTALPAAVLWWALPSATEVDGLRAQRDSLTAAIARLELKGGRVDWHICGAARRLCVRIDRKAPGYGEQGDYRVVKGY